MDKISLVIPCYNEEKAIPIFLLEVENLFKAVDFDYELIFVDDGSVDNTLSVIEDFSRINKKIKYISLSRNFGKESAMYAGLCNASGDYITIVDVDLQHPISLIPNMYASIKNEDYDSVATRKNRKGESVLRAFFTNSYYKLLNVFSDFTIVNGTQDFRLMKRAMLDSVISLKEYNRFSKGIFSWVGYKTKWIDYENVQRSIGESKWNFYKLFKYGIDGMVAFTDKPLDFAFYLGLFTGIVTLLYSIYNLFSFVFFNKRDFRFSLIIILVLFISSLQFIYLGILGKYLSKTYWESKKRPHYIVAKSNIACSDKDSF